MRVLVCGGRDYENYDRIREELEDLGSISLLIHGGARGADSLAARWASENNIRVREFKADWEKYGKRAGPIRNAQMFREGSPDYVLAFKGGRGTADAVRRAKAANIFVREVE